MKKIFFVAALLCASMMSFAIDWSGVDWLGNGVGTGYDQKYKAVVSPELPAPGFINNTQIFESIPVIHVCFPSAAISNCSLDASQYTIPTNSSAGFFHLDAFTAKETSFTIDCDAVTYTFTVFYVDGTTTAIDNVTTGAKAVKTIENGQLVIIKNGVRYNVAGQEMK